MSDAVPPEIRLTQTPEAASLNPVLSDGLRAEIDQRLASVRQFFAEERSEGDETLVDHLRLWSHTHARAEDQKKILEVANIVRSAAKAVVVVGIGGSDLGARVVREVLDPPFSNELPDSARSGAPRLYFTGNTFDPKELKGILSLLGANGLLKETVVIAISKSGATGETISAALIVAEALTEAGIDDWSKSFVAVTGANEKSALYRMNQKTTFLGILPIHDGVGGRFSVHTEVGLLPALVTAPNPRARLDEAVKGLTFADDLFFQEFNSESIWNLDPGRPSVGNVAFQLAAQFHLHEVWGRRNALLFYNYASDKSLGDWFTQLLSESIQERGGGLDVIPVTGPTGNHSILNGVARGPRNKLVLFLEWSDLGEDLTIPRGTGIGGELAAFEGLRMSQVQAASLQGTREDLTANGVPNLTLSIGKRDAAHLFGLFRILMDAIAVKGKLQNLDRFDDGSIDPSKELTYLQHGVEGYKNRTRAQALKMQKED